MKQSSTKTGSGRMQVETDRDIGPIKKYLIDHGVLRAEDAYQAEDYALTRKMPFEEAVIFLNFGTYRSLGEALAAYYRKSYQPLLARKPSAETLAKVPVDVAEGLKVFPVHFSPEKAELTLALSDPEDSILLKQLEARFSATLKLAYTFAVEAEIVEAIDVFYKGKTLKPISELTIPEDFAILQPEQCVSSINLDEKISIEKKIILLEPNLTRAKAIKALLKTEGYHDVEWILSPAEIQKSIKKGQLDLLLVNSRTFPPEGAWIRDFSLDHLSSQISFYDLGPLLLGQAYTYRQMSRSLVSMIAFIVRNSLRRDPDHLQEMVTKVRYCKLLALRRNLPPAQVDSCVLAAWLSSRHLARDTLLDQIETPYPLNELLQADSTGLDRIERFILILVEAYLEAKRRQPEVAANIDELRKLIVTSRGEQIDNALLETFLQLVRDEDFLKGIDQAAPGILVVDPDISQDSAMVLRLSNNGYQVTVVPSADAAIQYMKKHKVDFIISEVNLPGEKGLRFCQALRQNSMTAQAGFFFLTAETGERMAAQCLEAGADDFFTKPVDLELLSLKLQRVLEMKRSKDAPRGVTGSLADMNATDFVQSLSEAQKNVVITFEQGDQKGTVYMQNGEIIQAHFGHLKGVDAFYKLMIWKLGRFQIAPCTIFPPREIYDPAISLLMEGARQADESTLSEEELAEY